MLKKFANVKTALFVMTAFQILWLAGIWITRATEDWQKLALVGVIAALAFLATYVFRESFFEKIGNGINWLA